MGDNLVGFMSEQPTFTDHYSMDAEKYKVNIGRSILPFYKKDVDALANKLKVITLHNAKCSIDLNDNEVNLLMLMRTV